MKELIGLNMITFGISLLVIWMLGAGEDWKDLLILIIGEPIIMGILSFGLYLMINK